MKRRLGVTLGAATIIGAAGIGVGLLLAGGHTTTPGHGSTHVITVDQPIAAITSPATPSTPTLSPAAVVAIPAAAAPTQAIGKPPVAAATSPAGHETLIKQAPVTDPNVQPTPPAPAIVATPCETPTNYAPGTVLSNPCS